MRRKGVLAALIAVAAWLAVSGAWAQDPPGNPHAERFLRVEWAAGESRGSPVLTGYVYNGYGQNAGNVQLLVESLDAAGQVTARTFSHVHGVVPPFDRAYFEARPGSAAHAYRVSVASFEWIGRGGGTWLLERGPGRG